jgi:hypothetical protein
MGELGLRQHSTQKIVEIVRNAVGQGPQTLQFLTRYGLFLGPP